MFSEQNMKIKIISPCNYSVLLKIFFLYFSNLLGTFTEMLMREATFVYIFMFVFVHFLTIRGGGPKYV